MRNETYYFISFTVYRKAKKDIRSFGHVLVKSKAKIAYNNWEKIENELIELIEKKHGKIIRESLAILNFIPIAEGVPVYNGVLEGDD